MQGAWVLKPRNSKPTSVVHFIGGIFVGAAPQLTYRLFLERLSDKWVFLYAYTYNFSTITNHVFEAIHISVICCESSSAALFLNFLLILVVSLWIVMYFFSPYCITTMVCCYGAEALYVRQRKYIYSLYLDMFEFNQLALSIINTTLINHFSVARESLLSQEMQQIHRSIFIEVSLQAEICFLN